MERRASLRVPCGISLRILFAGEELNADLMNISERGMFIRPSLTSPRDGLRLAAGLTPTALLELEMRLAERSEPLVATAIVAWKSDFGFGLDFQRISESLRSYIALLASEGADAAALLRRLDGTPVLHVRD